MKCFYHKSDLDGHCAGAIVKQFHPGCEMIGVDYNDVPPVPPEIGHNEVVFVVDFSFPVDTMLMLHDVGHLVWVDHHKSAIEKMEGHEDIPGIRAVGKSGCELTWECLYSDEPMPDAVRLLGRYDVWDHRNPDVLPFQYGLRHEHDTSPENTLLWGLLLADSPGVVYRVTKTGQTILKYQVAQDAMYAKGMAYEAELEGLRAIVINKAYTNSKIFDAVYDPEKHDIMVVFGVKPGEFKYSLYSDKPEHDVSKIAVKFGGGGHAGAAGFYSETQVV